MTEVNSPLVSIIIRTHARPLLLMEAVDSVLSQSYVNLELIVVEDGSEGARSVLESNYPNEPRIRYFVTGERKGRSEAGNLGLAKAVGQWIGFLDDDDLLLPDHIGLLMARASESGLKAAYSLSLEVPTEFKSLAPLVYEEGRPFQAHKQPFSRPLLWVENYIPIQSVLFHRTLYEKWGGFNTSLDQLEDWDLWVRYSLKDDFSFLQEVTSKYRVPKGVKAALLRQKALLDSYEEVSALHRHYKAELSVRELHELLRVLSEKQSLTLVGRARRWVGRFIKAMLLKVYGLQRE